MKKNYHVFPWPGINFAKFFLFIFNLNGLLKLNIQSEWFGQKSMNRRGNCICNEQERKMEAYMRKEMSGGYKRFRINLYDKIKTKLREKRLSKKEKALWLKIAILSGGIKKVK